MNKYPEWILAALPHMNARTVLSRRQQVWGAAGLALLALAIARWPHESRLCLNLVAILFYLLFSQYKLVLQFCSMRQQHSDIVLPDALPGGWPVYTIMVPLYREEKAVPGLLDHLRRMDYPVDRLQILILVEEDDAGTRAAVERAQVAAPFETVLVPVSLPRTKPKACNYGLRFARGDLLVIYDAEDRPETDQIRKAACAFARAAPEVVCLQAQLNFYNRNRNLLTRLFTAEYSTWFDYCLPGLFLLDAPIPLGGTSNHFRLPALRELRGWDPFNVTEDCDLGVRLYVAGYRTGILVSTTWEEATFRLLPWIRQRSRWIKGYIQTYLVHVRQRRRLRRQAGAKGELHFHLLFGATAFCLLMNPFYWTLTLLWLATGSSLIGDLYPFWILLPALLSFLAANAAFVLSAMLGCLQRRYYGLVPYCLLMPLYWVLMSIGAWKGALQLLWRPFYWEKTPHDGAGAAPTGGTR